MQAAYERRSVAFTSTVSKLLVSPCGASPGASFRRKAHSPASTEFGTDFLYHFLSSIDYEHHLLVLRPVSDSAVFLASAAAAGATMVPMWLAADHLMLARAHVNTAPDGLFLIDTGGPGIGVDLRKSSLAAAAITPDASHPETMRGGGGSTQVLRFIASSVTIGKVTQHNLPGVYLPAGGFDKMFPFVVAGTISHEFFRHTAVAFDFASMTLVLTSY
ncbi:MAG: retropepsin-like domain-containing protein [Candidatus Eremiobacteraeota bacterium]|nr:retropepsin-like domain-containing protein [Candidatus Eremiobacteraeota bacterium]